MEKILFLTMLYDFYGELLTNKQKELFELYHLNDFSLNEISNEYKISRQAVLDSIKRSEKLLLKYEEKLSLIEKYTKQKENINNLINKIENLSTKCDFNHSLKSKFEDIKNDLNILLD